MGACEQASYTHVAANVGHDLQYDDSALQKLPCDHHTAGGFSLRCHNEFELSQLVHMRTDCTCISHQLRLLQLNGCIASGMEPNSAIKGAGTDKHL